MAMSEEAVIESVVVSAVVARVVVALLQTGCGSFFREAASLVVLTMVALVLEFSRGKRQLEFLKPRVSMSSGFLLGAITVPLVLSARLMQQQCLSSRGLWNMALERLRFEFWLAVASSLSMLLLMMGFLWKQNVGSWMHLSILEYISALWILLMTPKPNLWAGVVWSVVYTVGGKVLLIYILKAFPFSGTLGEVMLVVQGIVLYAANAATHPRVKIDSGSVCTVVADEQGLIHLLLQGIILGVLLIPLATKVVYHSFPSVFGIPDNQKVASKRNREGKQMTYRAALFFSFLLVVVFAAVPRWLASIACSRINPVVWALEFIMEQPARRLLLCTYWVAVITAPLPYLYHISASGLVPKILVRKYYHIMVVFMFLPALLFETRFLQLALGVALAGFLVLEMMRVGHLPPFAHLIERFMTAFTDHRDSGVLIISHFSLLLGCALPVWLNSGSGNLPLASFAGILSLGIGDTMASVIGYNFGSIRVSPSSKKTVEGTLMGIISMLVSFFLLIPALPPPARPVDYLSLTVATIAAGVLEAYTLQLDNAFIPLMFYTLLCL